MFICDVLGFFSMAKLKKSSCVLCHKNARAVPYVCLTPPSFSIEYLWSKLIFRWKISEIWTNIFDISIEIYDIWTEIFEISNEVYQYL